MEICKPSKILEGKLGVSLGKPKWVNAVYFQYFGDTPIETHLHFL